MGVELPGPRRAGVGVGEAVEAVGQSAPERREILRDEGDSGTGDGREVVTPRDLCDLPALAPPQRAEEGVCQ